MTDPDDLCPKLIDYSGLSIDRAQSPSPELNRFLYTAVGGDWHWVDRLTWTYQQWQEWVHRPELETWVAFISGMPAGYFELESQANNNVEIVSFGLLPPLLGKAWEGIF